MIRILLAEIAVDEKEAKRVKREMEQKGDELRSNSEYSGLVRRFDHLSAQILRAQKEMLPEQFRFHFGSDVNYIICGEL